jgi:glycosyltransferase involved in cell wall biosynthesis
MKKRLAIICTHPVQYYVPFFQLLQKRNKIQIKVFYTWEQSSNNQKFDPGFGKVISWNLPLLEGHDYTFVTNVAKNPGSHHFRGINNPTLNAEVENWKPDALLVFGWNFISHFSALRYFKGKIPVYFRGDSTLLNEVSQPYYKTVLRRVFLRLVYRYVDRAFYVGESNKEYFKAHGLKKHQLIFAPHAIDNHRFNVSGTSFGESSCYLRKTIGICGSDYLIIYVGKFIEQKNPELLLEAFAKLKVSNAHLLFIGNGPLEDNLRRKAQLIPRVHFLPFQNQKELPAIYAAADLLVLPSKSETWGLVVNEAMASGLPVIVSDKVGCANDLVKNGVNGYTFSSNMLPDLVEKLSLLTGKKSVSSEMGKRSYDLVQSFSYEKICAAIEHEISCL